MAKFSMLEQRPTSRCFDPTDADSAKPELSTALSESGDENPDMGLLDPIPPESEFVTKDSGLKVKIPEERRLELVRRQALARAEKEKLD